MDSIKIETGEKRLCINDDPERVITFNPSDLLFAEKFYQMLGDVDSKMTEYQRQAEALEADKEKDANDIPVNMQARFDLLRPTCDYSRSMIDSIFGDGTSQMVFGDSLNLDAFSQFFDGITPYFKTARAAKVAQYIPTSQKPARGTGRKHK